MKKSLILAFFIATVLDLSAQVSNSAYQLLALPTSAGMAAVGGDNISQLENDPAIVQHNPALLSDVNSHTL